MRSQHKVLAVVFMVLVAGYLAESTTWAYEEGPSGQSVVTGAITFRGQPPPPKLSPFHLHPNSEFCSGAESDGKGNRILREVAVNDGKLQDVVVYIQDINKGKPFLFDGTDVKIDHCRFLVQGGASTFVGVVENSGNIRIMNGDADPDDPKALDGVLHNPHTHSVRHTPEGVKSHTMFSLPLPEKGQMIKEKVRLKSQDSVIHLACDQHDSFEQAWFYPIENPYYSIVGPGGTFEIDQIPEGVYTLLAWHPILGVQKKEIRVGPTGSVTVNFEFSKK